MNDIISKPKIDERVIDSFFYEITPPSIDIYESFYYYINNDINSIYCCITFKDILKWEKIFEKRLKDYIPANVNCFVAGGSALTYILYENELLIRDYDIFIPDEKTFHIIDQHISSLKYISTFENEYTRHYSLGHIEIDLIKKPFPTIGELFDNFDINLCRVGFEVIQQKFTFKKSISFREIFLRVLKISNLDKLDFKKDGIRILKRLLKYSGKGFNIEYNTLLQFYANSLMAFSDKQTLEKETLRHEILNNLKIEVKKDYRFSDANLDDEKEISPADIFCDTSILTSSPVTTFVSMS